MTDEATQLVNIDVTPDSHAPGIVRVEVEPVDPAKYMSRWAAMFTGPYAHERASEYAKWLSNKWNSQ